MSESQANAPKSAKDLKGRAKEAAGEIAGNDRLKREGKVDQAGEKVKAGIDDAAKKVKDLLKHD
jgi:uncharacterized protein YjbJ (UPF0337 family)